MRVVSEPDAGFQDLSSDLEVMARVGAALQDSLATATDLIETFSDLVLRQLCVHEGIDQTILLLSQAIQFLVQVLLQLARRTLVNGQRSIEACDELFDVGTGQSDPAEVVVDALLHLMYGEIRQITDTILPTTADVVLVSATVALGLGVNEPTDAPAQAAAIAEEETFEVMPEHNEDFLPIALETGDPLCCGRPWGADGLRRVRP